VVGAVGERPRVAVPAPFNRDRLTRHKLVDRVTDVLHKIDAVALVSEKVPSLPTGLLEPAAGMRYTVFVARKQWAKVAEALAADPRGRGHHRGP